MIYKKRIVFFFCLLLTVTLQAQNLVDIFKTMPEELLPGVSENNKTILMADTSKTSISYIFGEISKVEHGDDYIKIKTSDRGYTQLKLLPVSQDSVIVCVIKTVCGGLDGDVCNSNLFFYSDKWEKLEKNAFLKDISAEIFFDNSQKESENYKYALSLPDISPISAEFNKDNCDLLLIFNYKRYISANHIAVITPFLKSDSIIMKWENSCFR